MAVTQKHPMIRWAVPALAVAAIGVAAVMPRADADPTLPPKTAEQLLVDLQSAEVDEFSGTVETRTDLGLPPLPVGDSDFAALLSGTNTVRVWQSDDEKSRVSLIEDAAETTVIRNGSDVWQWSSSSRTAKHAVIPEHDEAGKPHTGTPPTPHQAAEELLAAIEPTTEVSVSRNEVIAGRPAYVLELDPESTGTLVERATIAVDGETHAPLRVEIWAVDADQPAIRVGFTQVSFAAPDDSVFTFTPPSGATVEEVTPKSRDKGGKDGAKPDVAEPTVVGEGWESVTVATVPTRPHGAPTESTEDTAARDELMQNLPTVRGAWGEGKALTSSLVTVVITDDGRVAIGMVPTDRVVAAIPQ